MNARRSYDYSTRKGVQRISWARFVRLARGLAEELAAQEVDGVVGVARAGLLPAVLISCALRVDLFPVQLTRRANDRVVSTLPIWKVDVAEQVAGRRVAVVDEIADTGETLALAAARVRQAGAAHVLTACLVCHSWAEPRPHFYGLLSDALIIFPWDAAVYQHGVWQLHPELKEALGK